MDEMISRAAVIDVINESNSPIAEYLIGEIMALPSAQPETHDKRTEKHACDLISRQEVIDRAVSIPMFGRDVKMVAVSEIKNLPPAQPERKRGKWIPVTNGRGGHECSLCHSYAPSYKAGNEWLTDYCPDWGADMRKDEQE